MPEMKSTLTQVNAERSRLGDLAWVAALVLRPEPGLPISSDAIDWVRGESDTVPTPIRRELRDLEFVDGNGRRTAPAEWLRSALDPRIAASVRVFRRDRQGQSSLHSGFDNALAVIIDRESSASATIAYVGADALPDAIGRWIPLLPAWSFEVVDRTLSGEELEAAVTGKLRAHQSPAIEVMLDSAWVQWAIQWGNSLDTTEFVTVESWGTFLLDRDEDIVRMVPVVSGEVFVMIVRGLVEQLPE